MAYPRDQRVLILESEGTAGTMETPLAADFNVRCYDIEPSFEIEMDSDLKYATGDHSEGDDIPGAQAMGVSCMVKMCPSGAATTAPNWTKFTDACGAVTSVESAGVSITPTVAGDEQTHTFWMLDKTRGAAPTSVAKKVAGAMGTLVISADGVGKPIQAAVSLKGKYNSSADLDDTATASLVALTGENTTVPYTFINATATFGSDSLCLNSFSLDTGNTIEPQICQSDSTGYQYFAVTKRAPRITINPLLQTKSALDTLADWIAATTGTLTITVAGTIPFKLTVPVAQITNVSDQEREGVTATELTMKCQRNGVTGTPVVAGIAVEAAWEILLGSK